MKITSTTNIRHINKRNNFEYVKRTSLWVQNPLMEPRLRFRFQMNHTYGSLHQHKWHPLLEISVNSIEPHLGLDYTKTR